MIINGWMIFAHPLFLEQVESLIDEVERLRAKNPTEFQKKNATKRLAAIVRLAFELIPQDPTKSEYKQGSSLGEAHKHWFRAKFFQQYRLFFRYHQSSRTIVLAWVNDEDSKRAYENADLERIIRGSEDRFETFGTNSKPGVTIDSFTDYIVNDQLAALQVKARRMFGGVGLYAGSVFFGIIWKDDLYFKTNEQTRLKYIQAGMGPFQPSAKQTLKSYYQVPGEVVEHQDELIVWVREAVGCAQTKGKSKKTIDTQTEIFNLVEHPWKDIRNEIMGLEQSIFREGAFDEETMQDAFENLDNTIVLLRDKDGKIIGYSWAAPAKKIYEKESEDYEVFQGREASEDTAYVYETGLLNEYRGQRLVVKLYKALNQTLLDKGYTRLQRDSDITNGLAANILKNNKDKIIKHFEHDSPYGKQMFIEMWIVSPR